MVLVLFFGKIAEIIGKSAIEFELSIEVSTLLQLRDKIFAEVFAQNILSENEINISHNLKLTKDEEILKNGDEIAFFYAFSQK